MQRCREKQTRKRTVPLSVSKHMETPLFTGRVGGWSGRTHGRRAVTVERYAPLRVPSVRYRTNDVKGSDGTLLSLQSVRSIGARRMIPPLNIVHGRESFHGWTSGRASRTWLSAAINTATGPLVLYTIGRQSALCPFRPVSRPPPFPAVRRPIAGHSGEVRMTSLRRLAFVGNSLPRRCGIATFTTDLQQAISKSRVGVETAIVAMTDHGHAYEYPPTVRLQINDAKLDEYDRAAEFLNAEQFELVCLQHEFGIFGGDAGSHILALLARLTMPIVSTLHTILAEPRPVQRDVLSGIIDVSSKVIVMAEKARELLRNVYSVPAEKIEVIPHGIPNAPFVEPDAAKRRLGFSRKPVILTFGLLSPNKGIEVMIDAMPSILKSRADAVYVVLGATHPNLIRREGEAYRESLTARVRALGVEEHVVFLNQFVDLTTLLDYISMCDIYVTPYMNEAQMTSGTLAYSFGLGKAVVSTPYWHARELLADGRGILVPFGDPKSVGAEIA